MLINDLYHYYVKINSKKWDRKAGKKSKETQDKKWKKGTNYQEVEKLL